MPRKANVVVTPEEARRIEWDEHVEQDTAWQAAQKAEGNAPCPDCGGYKGYNPVSGVQLVTHHGRVDVEGHKDNCPRNVPPKKNAPPKA